MGAIPPNPITTPTGPAPTKPLDILGLPSNKEFFLWGISGLILIAVADRYPQVAIFFMWILIIGVLLINASDYITLLKSATGV